MRRALCHTSQLQPQKGFTFLELVVVLLIFGVLVSLVFYRTSPALERARVNRAAAMLAADLQYAQVVAARQRRPVAVIVSPSVHGYLIRDTKTTTVFRERFIGPNTDFQLDSLGATPATMEVFPNGVAVQSVTFTVGLNGKYKTVRYTRAGQIRVS